MSKSSPICFLFPLPPAPLHHQALAENPGPAFLPERSARREEGKASLRPVVWFPALTLERVSLTACYSLIVLNHRRGEGRGDADAGSSEAEQGTGRAEGEETEQTLGRRKKRKELKEERSEWIRKKASYNNKTHTTPNPYGKKKIPSKKICFWSLL